MPKRGLAGRRQPMTDRVSISAIDALRTRITEDIYDSTADLLQGAAGEYSQQLATVDALVAELAVLRAQRDAALAACDAAEEYHDREATEATALDADSPAAASKRGRAGGVYYVSQLVRAALGVQPEPAEVVHACPRWGSGVMPCCGRTPFEVPSTDRMTSEPGNVTCAGVQPEGS